MGEFMTDKMYTSIHIFSVNMQKCKMNFLIIKLFIKAGQLVNVDCLILNFIIIILYCCISGITKLRFKPAYNPYTEPSMEVFSYHEGTQK